MSKIIGIAVIVIIGLFCVFSLFGGIYCTCTDKWDSFNEGTSFRISFRQFLSLYSISPEKYKAELHSLVYRSTGQMIGFGYMDYRRYCRWVRKMEKMKKDNATLSAKQTFLMHAQNDLDAYRREAAKELEGLKIQFGAQYAGEKI